MFCNYQPCITDRNLKVERNGMGKEEEERIKSIHVLENKDSVEINGD